MHGHYVHNAISRYCEFHGPCVKDSGSRVGPIWPYSKNLSNLRKYFSLLCCIFVKHEMHGYDVHGIFYLIDEICDPQESDPWVGPI